MPPEITLSALSKALLAIIYILLSPCILADSRILATGGASTIEGQAGGGIVPWAVLAGYGSVDEWGSAVFSTQLRISDYALDSKGVALSYNNRIELSYARQSLDLGTLGDALSLSGAGFRQDIFGLKYRVSGDLIYNVLPQISVGMLHKRQLDFAVPQLVGATRDSDEEFYVSAAKLWLAGLASRNVFANLTARYSRANQGGLIGFGGDLNNDRELLMEASGGIFINRHIAVGAEYRQHSSNLSFSEQDDWKDVFIAMFVNKHLSVVAAYADLGTVATLPNQTGWYMSAEFSW